MLFVTMVGLCAAASVDLRAHIGWINGGKQWGATPQQAHPNAPPQRGFGSVGVGATAVPCVNAMLAMSSTDHGLS